VPRFARAPYVAVTFTLVGFRFVWYAHVTHCTRSGCCLRADWLLLRTRPYVARTGAVLDFYAPLLRAPADFTALLITRQHLPAPFATLRHTTFTHRILLMRCGTTSLCVWFVGWFWLPRLLLVGLSTHRFGYGTVGWLRAHVTVRAVCAVDVLRLGLRCTVDSCSALCTRFCRRIYCCNFHTYRTRLRLNARFCGVARVSARAVLRLRGSTVSTTCAHTVYALVRRFTVTRHFTVCRLRCDTLRFPRSVRFTRLLRLRAVYVLHLTTVVRSWPFCGSATVYAVPHYTVSHTTRLRFTRLPHVHHAFLRLLRVCTLVYGCPGWVCCGLPPRFLRAFWFRAHLPLRFGLVYSSLPRFTAPGYAFATVRTVLTWIHAHLVLHGCTLHTCYLRFCLRLAVGLRYALMRTFTFTGLHCQFVRYYLHVTLPVTRACHRFAVTVHSSPRLWFARTRVCRLPLVTRIAGLPPFGLFYLVFTYARLPRALPLVAAHAHGYAHATRAVAHWLRCSGLRGSRVAGLRLRVDAFAFRLP